MVFYLKKNFNNYYIGLCQYYHDENLRIAYRNSRDFEKLGYERSFYRFLCKMHDDMMRKIQKNKERLALTQGNLTVIYIYFFFIVLF